MSSPLALVKSVTKTQYSLITREQCLAAELSEGQLKRLIAAGLLERIRRNVYVLAGAPRTWLQTVLGAVLAAGEGALASHSTSSRLWDWRYYSEWDLELTVPRPRHPKLEGVHIHTSGILEPADRSVRHGVPCTSFERTLCDMSTSLSWLQLSRILDDGLRRKVATLDNLHACVERLDSGPNRRLRIVQALLAQRTAGFNPGDSGAELRFHDVLDAAGIPKPVQQYRVRVDGHTYELDFAWPQLRCFSEYYGLPWHIGASAVVRDSARITRLVNDGWHPSIFTDESTDAEIVREVARMLAIASAKYPPKELGA